MRLLLVFATVLVSALALTLTDEQKEKFEKVHKPCRDENGVPEELVTRVRNGEQVDDIRLKKASLCAFKKFGFAHENGDLNTEALRKRIRAGVDSDEEAENIVAKCAVKKDSPELTVYHTIRCLVKNAPNWSPVE